MRAVMEVSIQTDPISRRIRVASPYNPDFTNLAKSIGGRWDGTGKVWTFALENMSEVQRICMEAYGVTGGAPKPTREGLEARLAVHLAAIVEIQEQLESLDKAPTTEEGPL
jgi:hypothetical protein